MHGRYYGGSFLFIDGEETPVMYFAEPRRVFRRKEIKKCTLDEIDYLELDVSPEEGRRLKSMCQACVDARKPFNLKDLVLMYAPFFVDELSVSDAPTLNNTQMIILFLRECLDKDNVLVRAIEDMHSRRTMLDAVYERLHPYSKVVKLSMLDGRLVESSVL